MKTVNFWVLLYRAALIAVAVAIAIAVVCVFLPQENRLRVLQSKKVALQETTSKQEARLRELDDDQNQFRKNREFVERIAREQGMAKPGETIFRFEGTNAHVVARQP